MMKKTGWIVLGVLLAMGISGCQSNPDSSIVVNKDLDRLIEDAKNKEGSANVEDMKQYDTYQTTIEDESLGVKVEVDAKVDIPETEQMSVFRVRQKEISQEMLDQVKEELLKGKTLYDGAVLQVRTRKDVEEEIRFYRTEMNALEKDENYETMKEEYQRRIDELQEEYENAPEEVVWKGNESDGLLHRTQEMKDQDISHSFYPWVYELNPEGEVYYGATDGSDETYSTLYVQNNEEYGNCLRYRKSRYGYEFTASAVIGSSNLEDPYAAMIWKADEEAPDDLLEMMTDQSGDLVEYKEEKTTISQEEAQKTAEAFLEKLGLTEYQYYEGGLYCEVPDIRNAPDTIQMGYKTCYILRYARSIDGAFVTLAGTSKHSEGWDGDDYVKKDWPEECIEFRISDDGIIGFDYNAPLEIVETTVDGSGMKSFEEIKSVFEKMVVVTNANEYSKISLQIDRVVLGYARISEADSYDTGLLVPVWDFQGTRNSGEERKATIDTGSALTVNAIDGSVIDRSLGY